MDLTKLKEQAKQYALVSKKWRKTLQTVLAWAEKDLIWDDINGYEQRRKEAERKIEELIQNKQAKLENLKKQQDEISTNSTSEIASHIEFLKHEKAQIDELVSWTAALVENLPTFHKSFQENISKINDFITWLNNLNREIRKDADAYVQDYKRDIKKEIEEKKEELNSDLKEYYEEQKKAIKYNLGNEVNWWHKKHYFWKEWAESYDVMKKKWLFIWYTIIILLSVAIVLIDYLLIKWDVTEAYWGGGRLATWDKKLISQIIIPWIFSFWILVYWIVEKKIIESKFWKIFANFIIYTSSAILLVLPPLMWSLYSWWTYDFNEVEGMKILWRFFVYFMLLPICVYLVGKFVTWEYMHIYISNIVYWVKWFFKKLFYPFGKLFGLFEKKMLINVSWFGIKFRWKPTNELEEKTEHLNVLYNNVNRIDDQVRDIRSKCNEIVRWLKWSNKVFNERVKNLDDNLSKAYKELNRELEELERINQKSIYQIDQQINELQDWLWIDEYNLLSEREAIREWILEVYNNEN
mgnify:CR=1 FL=1